MRWLAALVVLPVFVAGCASLTIHDVTLSSVTAVDAHDQVELARRGDALLVARMAGNLALENDASLAKNDTPGRVPPHYVLLKVEFTSHADLSKVNYGDNLGNEIFFCNRPKAHTLVGTPYVYSNGAVMPSPTNAEPIKLPASNGTTILSYHVFVRAADDESDRPSSPPLESFNLREKAEDICFKLVGGAYRKLGYESNTVTIPATLIQAALQNAPGDVPLLPLRRSPQ